MAELVTESKYHRTLNGTELAIRREAAGFSQAGFADKCGYSQQFQQRLERPGKHEIRTDIAEKIAGVFSDYN